LILAKKGSLAGQDMPYQTGKDFEAVANALGLRKDVNYKKLN